MSKDLSIERQLNEELKNGGFCLSSASRPAISSYERSQHPGLALSDQNEEEFARLKAAINAARQT